jgi:hypothetical protein
VSTPDLTQAVWRKSSRSNGGGNECVEVTFVPGATAVRDSKNPDGGTLVLPAESLARVRFIQDVRSQSS